MLLEPPAPEFPLTEELALTLAPSKVGKSLDISGTFSGSESFLEDGGSGEDLPGRVGPCLWGHSYIT